MGLRFLPDLTSTCALAGGQTGSDTGEPRIIYTAGGLGRGSPQNWLAAILRPTAPAIAAVIADPA